MEKTVTGVLRISYYNVVLGSYVKKKAEQLLKEIDGLQLPMQRAFLRAFFDDEGCMGYRPKEHVRQIRGYQKNLAILDTVNKLLSNFGIASRFKKPNEVVIFGKKNLLLFEKCIGFSKGVKINGHRSNSRWGKHLEKQVLLYRAIASFSK